MALESISSEIYPDPKIQIKQSHQYTLEVITEELLQILLKQTAVTKSFPTDVKPDISSKELVDF
jgi:hypothetical protein